ncbi:MAG: hypothetical protein WBF64_01515 [Xanthobacteraceae bacterium]|jgi:hypothetical protein
MAPPITVDIIGAFSFADKAIARAEEQQARRCPAMRGSASHTAVKSVRFAAHCCESGNPLRLTKGGFPLSRG